MIAPLPGWSWEESAAGIRMRPRHGPRGAELRYVERVRPLAPLAELVAQAVPRRFREESRGPIVPFVTDEGEHAAALSLRGRLDDAPVAWTMAAVFLDDHAARLAGLAPAEQAGQLEDVVLALARGDAHLLGAQRRRRFVHAPPDPAVWHGFLVPPFHAYFTPRDYPRDPTLVTVSPALPAAVDALADLLARGPGVTLEQAGPPARLAGGRLPGERFLFERGEDAWDVRVLSDRRYLYPVLLKSTAEGRARHEAALAALVASIEPIPEPSWLRPAIDPRLLSQWAD